MSSRDTLIRHLAPAGKVPLLAAGFFERTVQIWNWQSATQITQFETLLSFGGRRLALSPDGESCIAAGYEVGCAGYDSTGRLRWQRPDLLYGQVLAFTTGGLVSLVRRSERLAETQYLDVATGLTVRTLPEVEGVTDSPYSHQSLLALCGGGLILTGDGNLAIPRLTFGLLDAIFSPEAVCISESGGPVRFLDSGSAREIWRYKPPPGAHVLNLGYCELDGHFYGVEREYMHGSRRALIRFDPKTGASHDVCSLSSFFEAFCDNGNYLISAHGELIHVPTGSLARRLPFNRS